MLNMHQKHRAAKIEDSIPRELRKYEIEPVEQTYITTDRAAIMLKPVKKNQSM